MTLLNDFSPVIVPDQVWHEVARRRPGALATPDVPLRRVTVDVSPDPAFEALVRAFSLDLGEQAALSLMLDHPTAIFLTDDAAARLAAMALHVRVHGTIGVVIRAMRQRRRSRQEVLSLLQELPQRSSLHIRAGLLQEIIAKLKAKS